MKKKLQRYFSLTDSGINNMFRAARMSFFRYMSFMLPPILIFRFLDDLIKGELKSELLYIGLLVLAIIIIYLALAREYKLTYDVTYEESTNLRIALAEKIKQLPLSYFSTHNLSDLSQTVMMDVSNIETAISHAVPECMGFVAFFGLVTILLCIGNIILGLAVTVPIWLAMAVMFATKAVQRKRVTQYYKRLLDNANAFQDAFEMQQEIKSYSMQDKVRADVFRKLEETERIHTASELVMAGFMSLIGVLPFVGPVLVAILGVSMYMGGQISLLYYLGYLMAVTAISHQYAVLAEFIATMFFFQDSFERIQTLQDEPIQKGKDKRIDQFDIRFDDVEFAYGDNKVINGVSFSAKTGEVTAIVGPSGCGKTTVLRLISRLYDYDRGRITVGGEEIKGMSTASLFGNIAIVFQNVELFDTSVMENIRLGRKDATDEEVLAAAKLANVDAIVEKLPDGYQTVIGENGSKLSGGERQRISIARAFLKDAPIILLDEISASLDVENEMEIQHSINKLIRNKTVIIVSHRMRSIEKADQIIVMNDGKVDRIGKHEALLAESPLYAAMVEKSQLTEAYCY